MEKLNRKALHKDIYYFLLLACLRRMSALLTLFIQLDHGLFGNQLVD